MGAKSPQTCAGLESNRFYAAPYMGNNGNLNNFGASYSHGTVFPPNQYAYQKETMGSRAHKHNRCVGAKIQQTCTDRESTRFYAAPYIGNNGNLRKFGALYPDGTVFPPNQCA